MGMAASIRSALNLQSVKYLQNSPRTKLKAKELQLILRILLEKTVNEIIPLASV